jgi:hypothetical protein
VEGYKFDYTYDGADREVYLKKPNLWIKRSEIVEALHDDEAAEMIGFYRKFQIMGMPYGSWGNNPNRLVEIVTILDPIEKAYNPRVF